MLTYGTGPAGPAGTPFARNSVVLTPNPLRVGFHATLRRLPEIPEMPESQIIAGNACVEEEAEGVAQTAETAGIPS